MSSTRMETAEPFLSIGRLTCHVFSNFPLSPRCINKRSSILSSISKSDPLTIYLGALIQNLRDLINSARERFEFPDVTAHAVSIILSIFTFFPSSAKPIVGISSCSVINLLIACAHSLVFHWISCIRSIARFDNLSMPSKLVEFTMGSIAKDDFLFILETNKPPQINTNNPPRPYKRG